jgi:hypothetical protein
MFISNLIKIRPAIRELYLHGRWFHQLSLRITGNGVNTDDYPTWQIITEKMSLYAPRGRLRGEAVQRLLILDLGTRWGEQSASRHGRALPPGKRPPVPIVQEAGWAPQPVWTEARGKILSPLPGIEPRSLGRPPRSQTQYSLQAHTLVLQIVEIMRCESGVDTTGITSIPNFRDISSAFLYFLHACRRTDKANLRGAPRGAANEPKITAYE